VIASTFSKNGIYTVWRGTRWRKDPYRLTENGGSRAQHHYAEAGECMTAGSEVTTKETRAPVETSPAATQPENEMGSHRRDCGTHLHLGHPMFEPEYTIRIIGVHFHGSTPAPLARRGEIAWWQSGSQTRDV
jgi:hypothetical protein